MTEMMLVLGGAFGLVLLYYGADALVRGGQAMAARFRVSPLIVGLTLVAFGTSAPELFVSSQAALAGLGDVCVGNIVGSNICNIALILGLAAVVAPMRVNGSLFWRDMPLLILVSVAAAWCCLGGGGLDRGVGVFFLVALVAYTALGILTSREGPAREHAEPGMGSLRASVAVVGGFAALIVGAKLLLAGAVGLERGLGVSDELVALTVVAVGTSLPELATSVVAARKGAADIAIGNIVGSNIFNILGILGFSAALKPYTAEGISGVDWIMMIATAVMLWPLMCFNRELGRKEGAALLVLYAGYLVWLCLCR